MNISIFNHSKSICFSTLLSAVLILSACGTEPIIRSPEEPGTEPGTKTETGTETETGTGTEISYTHTLRVNRNGTYKTIAAVAAAAKDSTLIEIEAGTYSGDVAQWTQNEIHIRAVGGEVILDAAGKSFGGKGIWEIASKGRVKVEGFTFQNSTVPDRNGAGIRFASGDLTVVNCRFLHNEMGILTGNLPETTLTVRNCEFAYSGYGDGYSHNLYVGTIDKVIVTGSYFHHAKDGQLLKSRARLSIVRYNRVTDENDAESEASYELDFPSGGIAVVVGNVIQQSVNSPNTAIVAFTEEYNNKWPVNALYLSHNTVLNYRTSGTNPLISPSSNIPASSIVLVNNLIESNIGMPQAGWLRTNTGNERFGKANVNGSFVPSSALYNSLLNKIAKNIDDLLPANLKQQGISLIPAEEYVHPLKTEKLTAAPKIPGAMQKSQ
ncbi:MAG: hypothetical protein LBE91_09775 [Tannerella sp.]|jgi:hypothetical protein|nr:hypothetical protein [Tannerella sp.]